MVRSAVGKSLFNLIELDVTELDRYPDGIGDIYERKIDGMIIHNVFSQEEVSGVTAQLLSSEPPLQGKMLNNAYVFGQALIVSDPDLRQYFEESVNFRSGCQKLFSGVRDFETRVTEVLSIVSGSRPVEVPTVPGGYTYTPATSRVLREGQFIPPHCGNQFLHGLPQYWHLSKIVELEDQLSYFVMLNPPEAGGELVLYDLEWADTKDGKVKGGQLVESVIEDYEQLPIQLRAGDMLLFDGGRIWHRVSPVQGTTPRITIGGFTAFSRKRTKVYYWS